jgi:high affinity sulfate transporter 1
MLRRFVPILGWLPKYDRSLMRGDLAAGIAVTALIVPKNLGYAEIAGVPVQNGLYAAAAGALLYAIFGTSKQVSTGPSSSLAAVAGGAVLVTELSGNAAAQLIAAIAIVTGLLFLLVAIFKLGWIARFMSKAVVTGFLAGAAIDVIIGELPKITGTSTEGDNAWRELISWFGSIDGTDLTTLLVGIGGLALILSLRKFSPKTPGALVVVVAGLVASAVFDLGAHGVALVGDVPSGLPTPALPNWDVISAHAGTIVVASLALLLIGFSQTIGDARVFATRHGYRIDTDQESVAQGMANVGAGVLQGMPVSTSLSASSLNEASGARSAVASIATGGFVVLTLLFLAPLFSDLPKAILAAVVIDAVAFGMIDLVELRRLRRVARFDFGIAIAAAAGALLSGVLFGVIIGIVLSLAWLIYVATSPAMSVLARKPGSQVFRDYSKHPEDELESEVAVLRLDSGLFFATTDALEDRVRELFPAQDAELRGLVLDLEGANFIDSQGAAKLNEIDQLCSARGTALHLARVKSDVLNVLMSDDGTDWTGEHRVHGNVHEAVLAAVGESAKPA